MEKYKIAKIIGNGAYGTVYKAVDTSTGTVVAIKRMKEKYSSLEECMNNGEIKALKNLSHPNVVKLKEVHHIGSSLYLVFEYLARNLQELMQLRIIPFPEETIKFYMYQALSGIAYFHWKGFFHRDLKPENLLVGDHNGTIKIADFGSAKEISPLKQCTEYVSTRWYRAPEVLLQSPIYGPPIDIFAMGCIMAELYLCKPIFPGNSEIDQLEKLSEVLGTPHSWNEGLKLARKIGFDFPNYLPTPLSQLIPNASYEAINLLSQMLQFDPKKRPTASECLQHPFFSTLRHPAEVVSLAKPTHKKMASLQRKVEIKDFRVHKLPIPVMLPVMKEEKLFVLDDSETTLANEKESNRENKDNSNKTLPGKGKLTRKSLLPPEFRSKFKPCHRRSIKVHLPIFSSHTKSNN